MRVLFNLTYQKLGVHRFIWGKEELIDLLLKQVHMRSWDSMVHFFQKALENDKLIDKHMGGIYCFYCNLEKCYSHHFDLKLISLLHQKDTWLQITPDMHMSLPFFSKNHKSNYDVVFIIHTSPVIPVLAMIRKSQKDVWTGALQVNVTKHFKQLFWDCPKNNPKIQTLFHSAAACLLRNNLQIPDCYFPGRLQELNGIWSPLQESMVLKWWT